MNTAWSKKGLLRRARMKQERWSVQGRLALLHQRCKHPSLLDVRIVAGLRLFSHFNASAFVECVRGVREPCRAIVVCPCSVVRPSVWVAGRWRTQTHSHAVAHVC